MSLERGAWLQQIFHNIQQMNGVELFSAKDVRKMQHKGIIRGDIRQANDLFVNAVSNFADLKSKSAIGTCVWRNSLTFDRQIEKHGSCHLVNRQKDVPKG